MNKNGLKILLVGSGGREHAIAWKCSQSPLLSQLYIAPGNAGTAGLGENLAIKADDIPGLVRAALELTIDLVIVGPEVPLTLGLVDALQAAVIPAFGPSQAAAQIEGSKAFSKAFMLRHQIPSAEYAAFTDFKSAVEYLEKINFPVVLKASGLAAGKGVILPNSHDEAIAALRHMLVNHEFGSAGQTVIIEERLEGEEVSLLAFSDGVSLSVLPPAQDHKRLLNDDQGPNTGGMGAYAPAPICPPHLTQELARDFLQSAIDGLRAEGMPFVGVLYAGLMLTPYGPRVLEYNCRLGDPETQAILPLLETDLLEIMLACTHGQLAGLPIHWNSGSSACVVLAGSHYPQSSSSGEPISGLSAAFPDTQVFHAGTSLQNNQIMTHGGRILGVTAWSTNLQEALQTAYQTVNQIHFPGMQFRTDIGARALKSSIKTLSAYAKSGVNIDAGNRAVQLMSSAVRSTYTPAVLAGIGSFGGLYNAAALQDLRHPVLVASTDGVGTKVKLAAQANRFHSIGMDIVNHCINDILVQGARPLFFLDYFATAQLTPEITAEIVSGIAAACRAAGCVLLGGETAEMPGVYVTGEFDLAGTIVGLLEFDRILPRPDIQPGDVLVGLPSSGPHTNGYSLIRQVVKDIDLDSVFPGMDRPLIDALLEPHRSYLSILAPALAMDPCPVKGLAHLTGGGFIENIPRILPSGTGAVIRLGSWPVPPLFQFLQRQGNLDVLEMLRVFNMGIGMVAVISPPDLDLFTGSLSTSAWVIGEIVAGEKKVFVQ